MNFKKTLLASLLMISASGVFAADTATLLVKGTLAPTACDVTLGSVSQAELTFDTADYVGAQLDLEPQTIPFKIACNPNAIAVTYTVSDDSSIPATELNAYGLGTHNEAAIGSYTMTISDATADNVSARAISDLGSGSWSARDNVYKSGRNSFASATDLVPVMAEDFSATLTVAPTINANLPVSDGVELAGAATFTITMI